MQIIQHNISTLSPSTQLAAEEKQRHAVLRRQTKKQRGLALKKTKIGGPQGPPGAPRERRRALEGTPKTILRELGTPRPPNPKP